MRSTSVYARAVLAVLLRPRATTGDVVKGCRSAAIEVKVVMRSSVLGYREGVSLAVLDGGNTGGKELSLS